MQQQGIELDSSKLIPKAVLKALRKLLLNSFWGKFGMRDYLNQTEFVHSQKRFNDLVSSKSKNIHDVHIVNDDCVMVTFSEEDDYNEGNNSSNLAIAALTTSYARLRLLKMLLDDRVLYFDTDSVIHTSKPGDWEPPRGNILGDWDNQLEQGESHIVSFASLGPMTCSYVTIAGRVEI